MEEDDRLHVRVYIPMVMVILIPICLIRNLKHLVPFSAAANVFILVSFVITLYYIFRETLDVGNGEPTANIVQLPLFLATVIFAMEGIGVVSTFSDIFVSMGRKYFKSSLVKPKKVMANG
jgi:proton-coupled amino acid transporter